METLRNSKPLLLLLLSLGGLPRGAVSTGWTPTGFNAFHRLRAGDPGGEVFWHSSGELTDSQTGLVVARVEAVETVRCISRNSTFATSESDKTVTYYDLARNRAPKPLPQGVWGWLTSPLTISMASFKPTNPPAYRVSQTLTHELRNGTLCMRCELHPDGERFEVQERSAAPASGTRLAGPRRFHLGFVIGATRPELTKRQRLVQFGPPSKTPPTCRESYDYSSANGGGTFEFTRNGPCPAWCEGKVCTMRLRGRRFATAKQLRQALGFVRTLEEEETPASPDTSRRVTEVPVLPVHLAARPQPAARSPRFGPSSRKNPELDE